MPSPEIPADVVPFYLKIDPRDIVLLKFTLESYEGLGVLRTINAQSGEVVFIALKDTAAHVRELFEQMRQTISFREIPLPADADENWLLGEEN